MAESKYSKYIISERRFDSRDAALPPGVDPESVSNTASHRKILSLDDMVLKGSSYAETVWMWPGGSDVYPETAESKSHAHDHDETLGFGTDFENPYELNGEIEFWIRMRSQLDKAACSFSPRDVSPSAGDSEWRSRSSLLDRPGRGLRSEAAE